MEEPIFSSFSGRNWIYTDIGHKPRMQINKKRAKLIDPPQTQAVHPKNREINSQESLGLNSHR